MDLNPLQDMQNQVEIYLKEKRILGLENDVQVLISEVKKLNERLTEIENSINGTKE